MERATVPSESPDGDGMSSVDDALGTTDLAVTHYRLAPGDGFPSGLHAHYDQEEVFVVLAGEAVFELLPPVSNWPDGNTDSPAEAPSAQPTGREVTVGPSEVVRFGRGEFQTGRNPSSADRDLFALALGAPKETDDVRIPAACPDCDAPALRLGTDGETFTFDCPDCSESFHPAPCPDCDSHALGMHLDDAGHPVSRCDDCGSEHPTPPLADDP